MSANTLARRCSYTHEDPWEASALNETSCKSVAPFTAQLSLVSATLTTEREQNEKNF